MGRPRCFGAEQPEVETPGVTAKRQRLRHTADVMARGGLAKQFSQGSESAGRTLQLAGLMLAIG